MLLWVARNAAKFPGQRPVLLPVALVTTACCRVFRSALASARLAHAICWELFLHSCLAVKLLCCQHCSAAVPAQLIHAPTWNFWAPCQHGVDKAKTRALVSPCQQDHSTCRLLGACSKGLVVRGLSAHVGKRHVNSRKQAACKPLVHMYPPCCPSQQCGTFTQHSGGRENENTGAGGGGKRGRGAQTPPSPVRQPKCKGGNAHWEKGYEREGRGELRVFAGGVHSEGGSWAGGEWRPGAAPRHRHQGRQRFDGSSTMDCAKGGSGRCRSC